MRKCIICEIDISNTRANRKFCSLKCKENYRYKRVGQRYSKEKRKEYYEKRMAEKPELRTIQNNLSIERYKKIQEFLRNFKLSIGCKDCGYNSHHAALEFDHIHNNKEINVCNAKSIERAKIEIQKCEVVCSNCHKIRTFNRIQEKKLKNILINE